MRKPNNIISAERMMRPHSDRVGMPETPAARKERAQGLTTLVSSVTAPLSANALPAAEAPVLRVMLAKARISPTKELFVPMVAELPTPQST
jgi:hypothetical protein